MRRSWSKVKKKKYRKKRYMSMDAEGNLQLLHSKGTKCKGCKYTSTPIKDEPCHSCLAGDGFAKFNATDSGGDWVYTCRHPYKTSSGKRGCSGGYVKVRRKHTRRKKINPYRMTTGLR